MTIQKVGEGQETAVSDPPTLPFGNGTAVISHFDPFYISANGAFHADDSPTPMHIALTQETSSNSVASEILGPGAGSSVQVFPFQPFASGSGVKFGV